MARVNITRQVKTDAGCQRWGDAPHLRRSELRANSHGSTHRESFYGDSVRCWELAQGPAESIVILAPSAFGYTGNLQFIIVNMIFECSITNFFSANSSSTATLQTFLERSHNGGCHAPCRTRTFGLLLPSDTGRGADPQVPGDTRTGWRIAAVQRFRCERGHWLPDRGMAVREGLMCVGSYLCALVS